MYSHISNVILTRRADIIQPWMKPCDTAKCRVRYDRQFIICLLSRPFTFWTGFLFLTNVSWLLFKCTLLNYVWNVRLFCFQLRKFFVWFCRVPHLKCNFEKKTILLDVWNRRFPAGHRSRGQLQYFSLTRSILFTCELQLLG